MGTGMVGEKISYIDGRTLRDAGRELDFPFRVKVQWGEQVTVLICHKKLRVLPEKRLVCLGKWTGQAVVAKFFLDTNSARRHCRREERGVQALIDAGIKTPALLGKGVLSPDKTPVLVFERIAPAKELAHAWQQLTRDNQRLALLCRVARVIAMQHEAGLKQDDLHLRNFLLSGDDIYTVDGDGVNIRQRKKPLSQAAGLKNLGMFFAQFPPNNHRLFPDAYRAYADKRGLLAEDHELARMTKASQSSWKVRKKKYLRKIYRNCSAFVCERSGDRYMVCAREFYNESMAAFLADPDPVIASADLLKDGNSATVAAANIGGAKLVVKRYNIKNTWHAIKRAPRPSRAWASWRNAHLLTLLGIPSARPIAFLERRWGPLRSTAYLITEYREGTHVYNWFLSGTARERDQERLAGRFGELVQMLADGFISHGDFKTTNFIVTNNELFIMDLDGMREHIFRWRFRQAFRKDLERLLRDWERSPQVERLFREQIARLEF